MLQRCAAALLLALVPSVGGAARGPPCADCSFNGQCTTSGCDCEPGWGGADCHELRLLPAAPPGEQAFCHFNDSTWGGTVLRDGGGVYHLWFSEMSNNCSLKLYGTVSRIVHATAASPAGPFMRESVALPVFGHNPQAVRAPDGTFLLYHIGATVDPSCVPDCRAAPANHSVPGCTSKGHGTSIAFSRSPYGPWTRIDYVLPKYTNPSPYIFPNGTVLLAARTNEGITEGSHERIHILRADSWRGPYDHLSTVGKYEDPFLWRGASGHFHMLSHDRDSANFFNDRCGFLCVLWLFFVFRSISLNLGTAADCGTQPMVHIFNLVFHPQLRFVVLCSHGFCYNK